MPLSNIMLSSSSPSFLPARYHSKLCKRWYCYSRDVRLSVCLSHCGVVSKWTSWFQFLAI